MQSATLMNLGKTFKLRLGPPLMDLQTLIMNFPTNFDRSRNSRYSSCILPKEFNILTYFLNLIGLVTILHFPGLWLSII